MTHRMHILARRMARKTAALKAPAHAMLCWLMVIALLGFTTNLCCCLLAMPASANSQAVAQTPSQTFNPPPAMFMASGGHGCCVKAGDDDQSPNGTHSKSNNPTPHDSSSCSCQGDVLDAPSHPTTIHHSVVSIDHGVFALPRLTASWQIPASTNFSSVREHASPPDTQSDTLVSLACQLTV